MNKKIGMFDSGIGGLTILKELKKLLPNEDYIYYADSKNNPYGEKSDTELMKIVTNIVDYLISRDVKIIVIACNTATTRCIKRLRMMYPDIPLLEPNLRSKLLVIIIIRILLLWQHQALLKQKELMN